MFGTGTEFRTVLQRSRLGIVGHTVSARPFSALILIELTIAFLSRLSIWPQNVTAFLALPFALTFPLQMGSLVYQLFCRVANLSRGSVHGISLLVVLWMVGAVFSGVALTGVGLFDDSTVFLLACYVLAAFSFVPVGTRLVDRELAILLRRRIVLLGLLIAAVGVIPILLFRASSPFPYMPAFDALVYARRVNGLVSGYPEYEPILVLLPPLTALPSLIFSIPPIYLYWSLPFLQAPLLSASVFILAYRLFRNATLSSVAAIVVVWFSGWGIVNDIFNVAPKMMVYVGYPLTLFLIDRMSLTKRSNSIGLPVSVLSAPFAFLILGYPAFYLRWVGLTSSQLPLAPFYPFFVSQASRLGTSIPSLYMQSFYALVVSLAIAFPALSSKKTPLEIKKIGGVYMVSSIFALCAHPEMGVIVVLSSLVLLTGPLLWRALGRLSGILLASTVLLGFLYYVQEEYQLFGSAGASLVTLVEWIPLRLSIPEPNYSTSFQTKMVTLGYSIGLLGLIFGFLGIIASFILGVGRRRLIMPALILIELFLWLLPWGYSFRMLYFAAPLIAIYAAILASPKLIFPSSSIRETLRNKEHSVYRALTKRSVTKTLWAMLMLYVLLNPLVASGSDFQNYLKSNYSYNGTVTTFVPADLAAASWIRENGGLSPIVVTDPMTLQVLTGLGVPAYSVFARTNISSFDSQQIIAAYAYQIKNLMSSFSPSKLNTILSAYASYDFSVFGAAGDHRVFLVVNWRTSLWSRGLTSSLIVPFQPFPGFAKLMNATALSVAFLPSKNYIIFNFNP